MRGKFITFEGVEGVGKSTQAELAASYLRAQGITIVETREPGGTRLGEMIRSILLGKHDVPISSEAELLLIFAARHQNIQENIVPALEQGQWVLCDRFTDASFAYQGGGRAIPAQRIATLERYVQGDLQPDLTVLFDLPVTVGLQRLRQRGKPDRFESERGEFFESVRNAYLQRAREHAYRFAVVDATPSIKVVETVVRRVLDSLM